MTSRQPAAKNTTTMRTFIRPAVSPLGAKSSRSNPTQPLFPKRPDEPGREEGHRHGQGQVEVGIGPAQERLVDLEAGGGAMSPPDRPHPRNQAGPVQGQDEDEDGGKEPERPVHQMPAHDAFEKAVEPRDEPLQEVLCPPGNLLHVPRRELGEDDEAQGDHPADDHGVGDRKAEGTGDLDGVSREAVFLRLGAGLRLAVRPRVRRRDGGFGRGRRKPGAPIPPRVAGRPPDPSRWRRTAASRPGTASGETTLLCRSGGTLAWMAYGPKMHRKDTRPVVTAG